MLILITYFSCLLTIFLIVYIVWSQLNEICTLPYLYNMYFYQVLIYIHYYVCICKVFLSLSTTYSNMFDNRKYITCFCILLLHALIFNILSIKGYFIYMWRTIKYDRASIPFLQFLYAFVLYLSHVPDTLVFYFVTLCILWKVGVILAGYLSNTGTGESTDKRQWLEMSVISIFSYWALYFLTCTCTYVLCH